MSSTTPHSLRRSTNTVVFLRHSSQNTNSSAISVISTGRYLRSSSDGPNARCTTDDHRRTAVNWTGDERSSAHRNVTEQLRGRLTQPPLSMLVRLSDRHGSELETMDWHRESRTIANVQTDERRVRRENAWNHESKISEQTTPFVALPCPMRPL